jgi:hypothetical protein
VKGVLEIFAAICGPPLLTKLAFPLCPVALFLKRVFRGARNIVIVADVDAELICNKEKGGREK